MKKSSNKYIIDEINIDDISVNDIWENYGYIPPIYYHKIAQKGMTKEDMAEIINSRFRSNIRTISNLLYISPKTFYRQPENKPFSIEISSRFLELIRLYKIGEDVFGNINEFNNWIRKENIALVSIKHLYLL